MASVCLRVVTFLTCIISFRPIITISSDEDNETGYLEFKRNLFGNENDDISLSDNDFDDFVEYECLKKRKISEDVPPVYTSSKVTSSHDIKSYNSIDCVDFSPTSLICLLANVQCLTPLYTSPGWLQPASEGQPLYSQSAISVYMTAGANPVSPSCRVILLETRVDQPRRVGIPL